MRRKCLVVAAPSHAGGLFNQIESLLGYAYIALTNNATLALPPLASHVVWPELVPFEDVFEPEPFILCDASAGPGRCQECERAAGLRCDAAGRQARAAHLRRLFAGRAQFELVAAGGRRVPWPTVVPVGRLGRRAREFLAHSGLARAEGGFGCLHARIERVSLRIAHRNAGGARRAWSRRLCPD